MKSYKLWIFESLGNISIRKYYWNLQEMVQKLYCTHGIQQFHPKERPMSSGKLLLLVDRNYITVC